VTAGWAQQEQQPLTPREQMLLQRVEQLEKRLAALESKSTPRSSADSESIAASQQSPVTSPAAATPTDKNNASVSDLLRGTTVNLLLDTYYSYNFNNPIGRVNYLRAYDVSSNAFSLNQAALVIENAPDPAKGKRFGARLDLQFGQATETLQGNPVNEPRPDVYRNIFQAYGTYVFPVSEGLTVDFGKWASSLGIENNYSKDQINYSRSYWFDFLPFYHMGARANFKLNDALSFNYWVVNGTQQTEPFNGYKDELFGLTIQPHKTVSWTVNYYLGQEHPDVRYFPNGAPPNFPTFQGLPFEPITHAPDGKLHIFDSYATWQAKPRLTLALEADYVIQRLTTNSPPAHTSGGAGYARYQLTPRFALGGRAEYLSDRGGLFTGVTQALKETTFTTEFKVADGFLMRGEWRRDFSNQPYFLTDTLGILKKEQNTATLGLIWWSGGKEGPW
jgi:hypothetical protein